MDIHRLYSAVSPALRRSRMERLWRILALTPTTRVLDVGGTPGIWALCPVMPDVTFLNLEPVDGVPAERMVVHDACALPFADKSFDLVFSNSLIEHLGTATRQRAFADEARRVGHRVWVQTPDPRFPIETHLLAPFLHWLPRRTRPAAARVLALRWMIDRRETPESILSTLRLTPKRELAALFPAGEIIVERFAGLPKSLIAII
jgi:SAM-dependent methyltransferase